MIRVVPPAEQTTRNAFRRRMSGWRYTTIPSLRILCCSVDRGTFSRAAAPRGPDRRPPVRRNASRNGHVHFPQGLADRCHFPWKTPVVEFRLVRIARGAAWVLPSDRKCCPIHAAFPVPVLPLQPHPESAVKVC